MNKDIIKKRPNMSECMQIFTLIELPSGIQYEREVLIPMSDWQNSNLSIKELLEHHFKKISREYYEAVFKKEESLPNDIVNGLRNLGL